MNERSKAVDTRDLVFGAALDAFAERGFHGATMRDIARRAGIVLSNVYHYSQSKSDLLVELLKRANYDHLTATEWALGAAGSDPADKLSTAVRAYVGYIVDNPLEALIAQSELRYLGEDDRKRLVVARDRLESIFENVVDEGVRTGAFTTTHGAGATRAILTMCSGIARWYRPDGPLSRDEVSAQYADYALAIVGAR